MEKQFFAYIRVSTAKQGDKGVSLKEQHDAILRYSQRYGLNIAQWFEERETAAKRGRPIFAEMLGLLGRAKASGVIIHKIDRSARNLKDWADLGDLIDVGVEVHFANESLDLNTRGGRLSADIQAVVAADYIRNLREEAKKGFYGRLKQGVYPMWAPIGYLDQGAGKPKEPDEAMALLVAQAFELYGTGKYSLPRLVIEMHTRGLRNRRGGKVTLNGMSTLLNNPFYVGVIRIRKTREIFQGAHRPIVSKSLFDRVQMILDGKTVDRKAKHEFIFRRMVRCGECGYTLIGEIQKGHVYYRCHTATCDVKTVREERIDEKVAAILAPVDLHAFEVDYLELWFREVRQNHEATKQQTIANYRLQLDQIRSRLGRLTDAYIDGSLEKVHFDERKGALILEEAGAKEKIAAVESGSWDGMEELKKFLELAKRASDLYKTAIVSEKRDLVKKLTSNLTVTTENVVVAPLPAVQELMKRPKVTDLSFTGQDQDTVSGMHDFLDRRYTPVQGRWLTPDPIGLAAVDPASPQSWNRYAYVMNNPLALIDPFGDDCYDQWGNTVQCGDQPDGKTIHYVNPPEPPAPPAPPATPDPSPTPPQGPQGPTCSGNCGPQGGNPGGGNSGGGTPTTPPTTPPKTPPPPKKNCAKAAFEQAEQTFKQGEFVGTVAAGVLGCGGGGVIGAALVGGGTFGTGTIVGAVGGCAGGAVGLVEETAAPVAVLSSVGGLITGAVAYIKCE